MFWSITSTDLPASSVRHPSSLRLALLVLLGLTACATPLSLSQRQQLETKTYRASYDLTFAACRDAFVNYGYVIKSSDFNGGTISVESERSRHNPRTALGLSIVIPPIGDFYMQRYGWALIDLLLWPWSIAWAAPSNYHLSRTRMVAIVGTVALQKLKPERTRVRLTLSGVDRDADKYPVLVRSLQEEIERQLFIKAGDKLGDEPQESVNNKAETR